MASHERGEDGRFVFRMTKEEYRALCGEDAGRCIACGAEAYGCEPDACEYPCGECDASQVYGLQELLLMGLVLIDG